MGDERPMAENSFHFTSESVSEGHPDKVADQISDAVLDELLKGDPRSRVACETLVKTGMVMLAGELTSSTYVDLDSIVRNKLRDIGYTHPACGFEADSVAVLTNLSQQSSDIAQGVNENEGAFEDQGAGDQGLMFGFACNETPELMPMPIALAHRLVARLAEVRKSGEVDYLLPDSKSQVSVFYENGKPKYVDTVVISSQHLASVDSDTLTNFVNEKVVKHVISEELLTSDTKYYVNPTGRFVVGGPLADAGLTGRKIIVDTYGGFGRHGGGAFSGKDPSKVDRSATYAARYLAKNVCGSRFS